MEEKRKEKGQLAREGDTVRKDGRGNGTKRNTEKIARGSRAEGQQQKKKGTGIWTDGEKSRRNRCNVIRWDRK